MANQEPIDLKDRMDAQYEQGAPWDTGKPCSEVRRRLQAGDLPSTGSALDLGCGTGTHSMLLLQHGLDVTGVDVSENAIERARERAAEHGFADRSTFVASNLAAAARIGEPFDAVLDRGCYHDARRRDLPAYQHAVSRLTRPGTKMLVLAFNADETPEFPGLGCVSERQLRDDFGDNFAFLDLQPFRLDTPTGFKEQPLFWSALLERV